MPSLTGARTDGEAGGIIALTRPFGRAHQLRAYGLAMLGALS